MSVEGVYAKLFERIRQIRTDEFALVSLSFKGRIFNRALEIGCGDGTQSILLKEYCRELISTDIDSRDISPERLEEINFVPADAASLPFENDQFDLIYSSNVLEHIENIEEAIDEMNRVLKPDGIMIHVIPNTTWKFLQLVLWVPFRLKILAAKLFGIKSQTKSAGEFGSPKSEIETKSSRWCPPVHGVAESHLEELMLFRVSHWKNLFQKKELIIEKSYGLMLYSAWNMGPNWLREFLSSVGLRSSHCFVLRKLKK
ncbi:MAG: class I SAM-dependent methyltransferase [bacterium]